MPFVFDEGNLKLKTATRVLDVATLCSEEGHPFYLYDLDGIVERAQLFVAAFPGRSKAHYAIKANNHPQILAALARQGMGADVVSGGEIDEALGAGFAAHDIIFSGVGKTRNELKKAIQCQIKQINIESPAELARVVELAENMKQRVAVAFRMNPDVNPNTHPYITTGFRDNKFGMDVSFLPELKKILSASKYVQLKGLTMHIGSQIRDIEPMLEAIEKTIFTYQKLKLEGYQLETFDVGGGLGINYQSSDFQADEQVIQEYGHRVSELLANEDCEIITEPGRVIVARFGVLLGEVQYIKETPYKNFAILNTGMHHLMRPCLYQAHHEIYKVKGQGSSDKVVYDVVGPICESSDVLGYERLLPRLHEGEWLAIADAGAYGAVMASEYNSHGHVQERVVKD